MDTAFAPHAKWHWDVRNGVFLPSNRMFLVLSVATGYWDSRRRLNKKVLINDRIIIRKEMYELSWNK